jgi:hypothetical protein
MSWASESKKTKKLIDFLRLKTIRQFNEQQEVKFYGAKQNCDYQLTILKFLASWFDCVIIVNGKYFTHDQDICRGRTRS